MFGHSSSPLTQLNFAYCLPHNFVMTIWLSMICNSLHNSMTPDETYLPGVLESMLWISILHIHTCLVSNGAKGVNVSVLDVQEHYISETNGEQVQTWEVWDGQPSLGIGQDCWDWDRSSQEVSLVPGTLFCSTTTLTLSWDGKKETHEKMSSEAPTHWGDETSPRLPIAQQRRWRMGSRESLLGPDWCPTPVRTLLSKETRGLHPRDLQDWWADKPRAGVFLAQLHPSWASWPLLGVGHAPWYGRKRETSDQVKIRARNTTPWN